MSAEDFSVLFSWLDATARFRVCDRLRLPRTGTPNELEDRVAGAIGASSRKLLDLLDRDDLVAMLRTWWWGDDGLRRAHLLGLQDASTGVLRDAVDRILVRGWEPRGESKKAGRTGLTLCWYDEGAPHPGEFEDDDGPTENSDDFLDEAIYTIVHPEALERREYEGVVLEEGRQWVAGVRFFERAQKEGRRLVVVLADSLGTGRLLGWTYVRALTVTNKTVCRTGPIVRMRRGRFDSVRKLSDGQPLAFNYIRPYAPCQLPSFVPRTASRLRALEAGPLPGRDTEPLTSARASSPASSGPVRSRSVSATAPLVAFSWGYEGWGSHTPKLVSAFDAIEAERGFDPPLFVDVRISRSVRATGFRERAFEKLLGPERHVWLPGLGNRAVHDRLPGQVIIDEPKDARTLLDLVTRSAARGQRVIFFCSCGSRFGRARCHRGTVTQLLLAEARRQKVALSIHEWPGGSPVVAEMKIPAELMSRLRKLATSDEPGGMRIPVSSEVPITRAVGLPHLSILRCRCGDEEYIAASGSAFATTRGWMLPVYSAWPTEDLDWLRKDLDREVRKSKLHPFGAELHLPARWREEPLV